MYVKAILPLCIICPEHGEFWQKPNVHLKGCGCPKCANEKTGSIQRKTTEEFIIEAKKVHGDKYDYSKSDYKGANKKICIICPKHGEFWQTPLKHLSGQGCPKCSESFLENEIRMWVENNNIKYISQKSFDWLKNGKGKLKLDFYLPDYKIAIECQGGQHFEPVERFGGEESFEKTKNRDLRKYNLCKSHGIKILYFNHDKHKKMFSEKIIHKTSDIRKLLNHEI